MSQQIPIANILLNSGADVNAVNNEGETPLHTASSSDDKDGIEKITTLINAGATLSLQDKDGYTPLHTAVTSGIDNAGAMIDHVDDKTINIQNNKGESPLHIAAKFNAPKKVVETLVKKNANLTLMNNDGNMPIHLAAQKGHYEIIEFILSQDYSQLSTPNDNGKVIKEILVESIHHENSKAIEKITNQNIAKSLDKFYPSKEAIDTSIAGISPLITQFKTIQELVKFIKVNDKISDKKVVTDAPSNKVDQDIVNFDEVEEILNNDVAGEVSKVTVHTEFEG